MVALPKFSKNQVRKAGEALSLSAQSCAQELDIVDYWRAAHQYPLDRMAHILEEYVLKEEGSFAACRLKRIDSIKGKLARKGHTYKLNSMYDIAGCRLVSNDVERVYEVVRALEQCGGFCSTKDYIDQPQPSGYRGVHLIHQFNSPRYGYESLKVETQVRTNIQHMWATAVEVYDVVTQNALKFGAGEDEEKRFFALASQLFAQEEQTNRVPGVSGTASEVLAELIRLNERFHITNRLKAYSNSVSVVNDATKHMQADYVLLMIDFEMQQITLTTFPSGDEEAVAEYGRVERRKGSSEDAVLLKASSMEDIQKAYPNYYSDISLFLKKIDSYIAGQ